MEDFIFDGEVHDIPGCTAREKWKYAIVKLEKPFSLTNKDSYFIDLRDKLIDKYFEYLRKNFNPMGYNENFQMVFRPNTEGEEIGTLAIKFKI